MNHEHGEKIPRGRLTKLKFAGKAPFFDMLGKFFKAHNTSLEVKGGDGGPLTTAPAIEGLTRANPSPDPGPDPEADVPAGAPGELTDRDLAAIHFANKRLS